MAAPLKTGRVWITRTLPEAEKTARRVEDLGCEALIWPVLEVHRLKVEWPDVTPDAVVLTSHHALEALMADGPFEAWRQTPLFVVGETLKAKGHEYGFKGPITSAPESRDLLTVIADQVKPGAYIVYLAPRDPATPLSAWLKDKGYKVDTFTVYETLPNPLDLAPILTGERLFILVHSPRAGLHLGQSIRAYTNHASREFALDVLTFICISEAAQAGLLTGLDLPTRSGVNCLMAERPDEASLIARLIEDLKTP